MEWRNLPVSKALIRAAQNRVEECKDALVESTDPDFDRIVKGIIKGHLEHLDVYTNDNPEIVEIIPTKENEE